jgi:ABC-type amino acid transport system permease subunit
MVRATHGVRGGFPRTATTDRPAATADGLRSIVEDVTTTVRISVRATLLAMVLGIAGLATVVAPGRAAPAVPAAMVVATTPAVPPSGSRSAVPVASPGSRVGGSPGAPAPRKPGWVWWAIGALVVILGVGGFRLWRSRDASPEPSYGPEVSEDAGNVDQDGAGN